ncbi:hypothetical protein MtrunA17_Chr3g0109331 [Medicago truncatula]|uniref:Transmembrane protein, putative n=1 Tax=Medicago truncatula TaxID=3880 RepID=G7J777_MEDTR|nr:uncharacterized protein LOC11408266 [Medicago truncatula]XP_024633886.1 uncharacterized protein LOC11408266 [Medicago truncatula]AES70834.1 transmembrane protein, putative [Medicago truncatula]RHN68032.1 hypothetical protein MtrunA17_Chr3g0109331 [Medicago truncatula]
MIFSRKHVQSVIALLLIALLSLTWNLNSVSASSGGVAGGSFFDSDSSSSDSFTSDSDSERVREHHHMYDSPPHHDGDDKVASGGNGPLVFFMIFAFGIFFVGFWNKDANGNRNSVTVLKLQVGMLVEVGNTIQRDLARIAEAANTSSREGVCNLLKETMQTLDQHHGFCVAGYSSVDLKRSKDDGEKCYNQLSNEERAKFDEETLVNLTDNHKTIIRSQSYDKIGNENSTFDVRKSSEEAEKFETEKLLDGPDNKYIVIILLVAVKGAHKLPDINGAEDLKEVLPKLKSLISSKYLLAGEVLWTPQKENDTVSDAKLLKDYLQLAKSMKISKKHE